MDPEGEVVYTFTGWEPYPGVTKVTQDMVYRASYNYIYDLEKVGDEYKIVRYDPFK